MTWLAAHGLLDGLDLEAKKVLADKGYDSSDFIARIEKRKGIAVIPPRNYRKTPREYDRELYKNRDLTERLFGRMKRFKHFALRCEKTAMSFLSVVLFHRRFCHYCNWNLGTLPSMFIKKIILRKYYGLTFILVKKFA